MKRAVHLLLASLLLLVVAISVPKPVYAAVYGAEGSVMMTGNVSMVGLAVAIMGACSDSDVPQSIGGKILYYYQTFMEVIGQYSPGECPQAMNYNRSLLAGLNNTTLALYSNPPASTQAFAMDVGQTLGFIPHQVQAQGIGFSGLSVLLPIWKSFRNVAYAMLAIILIIIGFMVMFRKKIDPKTVVTVQNAIPRVVIALLLVTFSYAIVGLMIDLMYFVIVLAAGLIVEATKNAGTNSLGALVSGTSLIWSSTFNLLDPSTWFPKLVNTPANTGEVTNLLLNGGLGGLMRFFFGSGFQAWDDIGKLLVGNWNPAVKNGVFILQGILTYLIGGGGMKGAAVAGLTSGPVLLLLIILIVLVFGMIRLIFMLIDAYISIIISLLFSPFQLMLVAIPGTDAFGSWFRWLVANVLVFPLTAVLLLIAAFLTSQTNATQLWAPPLLSGGQGVTGMAGFIGLGMLLIIPTMVGSIKKALKAEPFIPGGVGAVMGPIGSGVGQLWQLGYQYSFISSAIRHKPDARTPMQTIRDASQKGFGSLSNPGGEGH